MQSRKIGRPTKYKKHFSKLLLQYFDVRPYFENKTGKLVTADFPSIAGFAISIGVHRDTLHEWATKYPEFSDAYKRAKDFQENYLVINGNKGLINSTFAIFTAKNVLNWRDNSNVTIKTEVEKMTDEQLENEINMLLQASKQD